MIENPPRESILGLLLLPGPPSRCRFAQCFSLPLDQVCPLVNEVLSQLDVTLVHSIAGKSPLLRRLSLFRSSDFSQRALFLHTVGQS